MCVKFEVVSLLLQIFWSENELKMIQQSSLYQETIDQKAQIKKEFLAIKPVSIFSFLDNEVILHSVFVPNYYFLPDCIFLFDVLMALLVCMKNIWLCGSFAARSIKYL